MPHEIYINAVQHKSTEDGLAGRRRSLAEVHRRALRRRPGWIAWHLGRIGDEALIERALASDPDLATNLELRMLDDDRIGIVIDETLAARLTVALRA